MTDCLINSFQHSNLSLCSYRSICQYSTVSSYQIFLCLIGSIPFNIHLCVYLLGTLLNLLFFGTFCQANVREMGSGIYRLWISLIGQLNLTIIICHVFFEMTQQHIESSCIFSEYFQIVLPSLVESSNVLSFRIYLCLFCIFTIGRAVEYRQVSPS
ncbi:unnamed protein product [Adineta ricciae]|uniref:Uncharacterized protein n=1 Tax=Adineta ricciae TaxID=249248 RepID=A0A813W390_ADIRI|nr:unnamed protein product [Adineta ricciae]